MEQNVKFSKLYRMQALVERDGVDSIRFIAGRLSRLSRELLMLADDISIAVTDGNSDKVLTNLYLAISHIETDTTDMTGKLSRTVGRLEALLQLREKSNEADN